MAFDYLKTLAPTAGLTVLIVLALVVVHRYVLRAHTASTGKKFRNQLIMLGLSGAGMLVILLVLPMKETLKGQILSLLGIVLSAGIALSSTTLLGNAMAGFMIRAVRAFRLGEFIEMGEHFGRVSDMGLFHVEIQTEDRDLKTLPNLLFVTNAVKRIRPSGTILSAHVSLGYDVAPGRVQQLLLRAAEETGLKDPFARVIDLGDDAITYKVAGLLEEVPKLLGKRSDLRLAMMHALHTDGIEIVSPKFRNTRIVDGNRAFIPPTDEGPAPSAARSGPEAIVFDKAEEAASIESLRQTLTDLEKEREALRKTAREGGEDPKGASADELARLDQRAERLAKVIEARENRAAERE